MNDDFKIELKQILAEMKYEPAKLEKGYSNKILQIDIGKNDITTKPVSEEMKETFTGGKGFDLRLIWDLVKDDSKWNDPENTIAISSGPLGGTTSYPGSGKSIVACISPLTDIIVDSNVGGFFGPLMKFAGWDAVAVTGKANQDVLIYIDGVENVVKVQKMTASDNDSYLLSNKTTELLAPLHDDRQYVSVIATGKGAEHTRFGILNFSYWDWRRKEARYKQAGRGGIGTVFRDKKILAIAVRAKEWKPGWKININY